MSKKQSFLPHLEAAYLRDFMGFLFSPESMTYSEKLKDPRWQKLRLAVLQRDEWRCQYCGDTKTTLHVHHRYYLGKNPWDTPEECLQTLCEDCHSTLYKMTPLEAFLYDSLVVRDKQSGCDMEWFKMTNRVVNSIKNGETLC